MPAIIEQLPTSDDEDQPTPPTECHQPSADSNQQAAQASPAAPNETAAAVAEHGERDVDVAQCSQLKEAGNQLFKEGNVAEALAMYRRALWCAPIKSVPARPAKGSSKSSMPKPPADAAATDIPISGGADDSNAATSKENDGDGASNDHEEEEEEATAVDTTDYTLTAQVYCNAGFCLMKLDVKEEAAQMLSEAIRHDEAYLKAYLRRADCYYDLQKWSNAYGDYENYEKLGGVLDAQGRTRKTYAKQKVDEEMQKMLGELKNIGNKILGNFGLSTDNFKFDKDPNTGGYSMRFER